MGKRPGGSAVRSFVGDAIPHSKLTGNRLLPAQKKARHRKTGQVARGPLAVT
ncbi:MAG: hypothetical protein P8J33_04535 [Pirellulaceae bacterium]|nr:hypothetical protein [Pirellulaceae bacterium]